MHDDSNWLDYDSVFRQQAVLDPSLRWNTVHPGIQAITLVGRTAGSTLFCGIQITPITPHAQRERGKVIGRGVHIMFVNEEKKI